MIKNSFNKKPLIAVHRGKSGGSIIENTILSAKCAILSGADIVEFDVQKTLDNKIVVFHTFMERKVLSIFVNVSLLPLYLLKKIAFVGAYGRKSGFFLNTLEEYLYEIKGKCILNLDRIWKADIKKCLKIIEKLDMFDQIIIKSDLKNRKKVMRNLSKYKNAVFMAICKSKKDLDEFEKSSRIFNVNIDIIEALFYDENDYLCSKDFLQRTKMNNQKVWVNAIDLHKKANMCAFHGDNTSISLSRDKGWGWLIDKGFDIIQTDWPCLLSKYIEERKKI